MVSSISWVASTFLGDIYRIIQEYIKYKHVEFTVAHVSVYSTKMWVIMK